MIMLLFTKTHKACCIIKLIPLLHSASSTVYITGLSTERRERPSLVSSLVKLMHGSGTASSLRDIVLNLHVLRWSAMLEMLANFHSFTVSNAVLNRHT